MKKTFIALVALIIASTSIFLACSKDNEEINNVNTENIKEKCAYNDNLVTLGYVNNENIDNLIYTFNFTELVSSFNNHFENDLSLYKFHIIDNEPFNSESVVLCQIVLFNKESNNNIEFSFPISKFIDASLSVAMYYIDKENVYTLETDPYTYDIINHTINIISELSENIEHTNDIPNGVYSSTLQQLNNNLVVTLNIFGNQIIDTHITIGDTIVIKREPQHKTFNTIQDAFGFYYEHRKDYPCITLSQFEIQNLNSGTETVYIYDVAYDTYNENGCCWYDVDCNKNNNY